MNLISNAIKFSHNEGVIRIETLLGKNDSLSILVHDFGIGIHAEDTERIFDRFVQLDSGTRKFYGGHGLGLSVTQAIVELLGGSIILTSDEGKGSVFKVSVPPGELHPENDLFDEEDEFLFSDDDNVDVF
jgi:signal transduction histidine kinase